MLHVPLGDVSGWAVIAATHEELAKLGIVAVLAILWGRRFHDPMDGIIYGAFAGIGMAIQESLLYLSLQEEPGVRELGVEAVRFVLHAVLGGLSAFGVGLSAAGMRRWPQALMVWLATSVALHYLWDVCVGLRQSEILSHAPLARTVAVALVLMTLAAFGGSLILASRWSRQKYAPGSSLQLWGWPFTALRLPDAKHGFSGRSVHAAPQAVRRAA
jgi:RsiW-degrading membrane proteinase PrsW (M82 family)